MTIRELYAWAKRNGVQDCETKIQIPFLDILRDLEEESIVVEELSYDEQTEKVVYI